MDPNANIREQLELARGILERADSDDSLSDNAIRLAELVLALNTWITRGGFLPDRWEAS